MLTTYNTILIAGLYVLGMRYFAKIVGDLGERLIQAGAIGGPPVAQFFPLPGHPQSAVAKSPLTVSIEEPGLPPMEQTIVRMADYLEQQFREQGSPIGRAEAVAQARIMMAESGVMG